MSEFSAPWDELHDDNYFANSPIPGMISADERKMLFWAARDHWTGAGEIVEIGAFAGLSTSYLGEGMRRNARCPRKASRLHVFDRFRIDDTETGRTYLKFLPQLGGDYRGSFQHLFEENTRAWGDLMTLHAGDTGAIPWSGEPIEVLFIDCSISMQFHEMLFRKFYPYLIPERSLLIHQDFFYHRSYYLAPMMKKLQDFFEPVANADTSVVYHHVRRLDDSLLSNPLFSSTQDMLDTAHEAIEDFGGITSQGGGVLAASLVFFHASHGQRDRARQLAFEIERQNKDAVVLKNLKGALAA
jgi:hypothetical protein